MTGGELKEKVSQWAERVKARRMAGRAPKAVQPSRPAQPDAAPSKAEEALRRSAQARIDAFYAQPEEMLELEQKHKKRQQLYQRRRLFIVILACVALFLPWLIKMSVNLSSNAGTFHQGVYLDGTPLTGLSEAEAEQAITQQGAAALAALKVHLSFGQYQWSYSANDMGLERNAKEAVAEAFARGRTGNVFVREREIATMKKEPWLGKTVIRPKEATLKGLLMLVKRQIDTSPEDASLAFLAQSNQFELTSERIGVSLDVEALYNTICEAIADGQSLSLVLEPQLTIPDVRAADLQAAAHVVAKVTLAPISDVGTRENAARALEALSGTIIPAGGELSFNGIVGAREAEQGYVQGTIMRGGRWTQVLGGGVERAASMLYQAGLVSGMEVVTRHPLESIASFAPVGTDADVFEGRDLVLKNPGDLPMHLYVQAIGGQWTLFVYAAPEKEGMQRVIEHVVTAETQPPAPQVLPDATGTFATQVGQTVVWVAPVDGGTVETYLVYQKDGVERRRELIVTQDYAPVQGISYIGVARR